MGVGLMVCWTAFFDSFHELDDEHDGMGRRIVFHEPKYSLVPGKRAYTEAYISNEDFRVSPSSSRTNRLCSSRRLHSKCSLASFSWSRSTRLSLPPSALASIMPSETCNPWATVSTAVRYVASLYDALYFSDSHVFISGQVYDDSCNHVDSLTTNGNPCDSGTFGCSPPPVIFNRYTNTFTHLV